MKLNYGRILLGGLLAGLAMNVVDGVVNGVVLGDQYREIMRGVHAEQLLVPSTVFWISMDFVYALAMSYLGAAMRPTFGTGIGPYIRAGIAVWLVGYLTSGWDIIVGILPLGLRDDRPPTTDHPWSSVVRRRWSSPAPTMCRRVLV